MRPITSLIFLLHSIPSIALSIPSPNPILDPPSHPQVDPPPSWPPTPWSYRDGPKTAIFAEYGRQANSTLSQRIQSATLKIEEKLIKGDASYRDRSIALRSGVVTLYVIFAGKEVRREEIFRVVDMWRVYAGAFGAREIVHGDIVDGRPRAVAASFAIRFDGVGG